MNYLTSINLNKNELQNAVLHPLAVAPENPKAGQIYYNTVSNNIQYYDGKNTKWVVVNDVDLSEYALKTDIKVDDVKLNDVSVVSGKIANIKLGYHKKLTIGADSEGGTISKDEFDALHSDLTSYIVINDGTQEYKLYRAISNPETLDMVYENTFSDTNGGEITRKIKIFNYKSGETTAKYEYSAIYHGVLTLYSNEGEGIHGQLSDDEYARVEKGEIEKIILNTNGMDDLVYLALAHDQNTPDGGLWFYTSASSNSETANKRIYEVKIIEGGEWWWNSSLIDTYHYTINEGETVIRGTTDEEKEEIYLGLWSDPNSYLIEKTSSYEIVYRRFNRNGSKSTDDSLLEFFVQVAQEYRAYIIRGSKEGYSIEFNSYVFENQSNRVNAIEKSGSSEQYPTTAAVVTYVGTQISNETSKFLPLAGGTITNDLTIEGNLTVKGTTTTIDTTTLVVKDKLIEVAHDNTTKLTSPAGLLVSNYDGTNSSALVFDSTGTAYVGDVVLKNGDIDVGSSNLVPLAGRAKSITDKSVLRWNNTNSILESAGFTSDDVVLITGDQTIDGNKLFKRAITIASTGNKDDAYTTYAQGQITFHNTNGNDNIFYLPVSTEGGTKTLATTDDLVGRAKKISQSFKGDGTKTTFVIEHGLGVQCTVTLYKENNTTPPTYEMVMADITLAQTSTGYTATVRFGQAPAANDTFVLVITG